MEELEPTNDTLHANFKLNEKTEKLLEKRLKLLSDVTQAHIAEISEEPSDELYVEPEITDIEEPLEETNNELGATLEKADIENTQKTEGEAIETDKLLELVESDNTDIDLSHITLIKAPKKS